MAVEWRNNRQPVDGLFIVDVDAEDGSQPQTFKGKTLEEVSDKLANAQVAASRRINELKREVAPDPLQSKTEFKPRALTAEEEFQATHNLTPELVTTIVEAQLGAPLEVVRQKLQEAEEKEITEAGMTAAREFKEATPDWYATDENKLALMNYMAENRMAHTAKNFGIAFDRLMGDGLLTLRPETTIDKPEENATERIVPQQTTRPRGRLGATGVRSSDVGHTPAPTPKPKYTRQDIEAMPKSVYAHKMTSEAGFAALVNSMRF